MRQFKFSMQSMLALKEAEEKQAKSALAAAMAQVARLEESRLEMVSGLTAETAAFEEKVKRGISAGDYRASCDYFDSVRAAIDSLSGEIAKAQAVQAQKQSALQEIYKDRKTLERLREEQYKEFMKQENLKESKSLEDILLPKLAGTATADNLA